MTMSSRKTRRLPNRASIKGNRPAVVDREAMAHVNRLGRVKVSYLSEATAKAAASRVSEAHRRPLPDVYRCCVCCLWHVGGAASTVAAGEQS
jgi:hypothetical protein